MTKKKSKRKVVDIVEEILVPFFEEKGYSLYHKEFVKEGPDWYLRVFIEKQAKETSLWPENVTADDCEIVSKFLSKELDEIDPIEQNYYLEISSPGLERPLLRDEHFDRYKGHIINVRLYKGLDGKKNIQGKLLDFDKEEDKIQIEDETGKVYVLQRDLIAAANLTIVF